MVLAQSKIPDMGRLPGLHPYKVFCRLDIKLFRTLVADYARFFAALAADALIGCAGDDLFHSWQLRRQLLPPGMFARLLKRQFHADFQLGLRRC
jgi:hypothetical protein